MNLIFANFFATKSRSQYVNALAAEL